MVDDSPTLISVQSLLHLQVQTCLFLLHIFLPSLPWSSRWSASRHFKTLNFSQDLCLIPPHHMPKPPRPSYPEHSTQLPHPTRSHFLSTYKLLTRSSCLLQPYLHIPKHLLVTAKQYTFQSPTQSPRLPPAKHYRSYARLVYF